MTQYRLHYAGSTFQLKDKTTADALVEKIRAVIDSDAAVVTTVDLVEGTLSLFLTRGTAAAVSFHEENDSAPVSVYETRGPLVI